MKFYRLTLNALILLSSCTYQITPIDFDRFTPDDIKILANKPSGDTVKFLGKVRVDEKGMAWDGCDNLAERALMQVIDEARAKGGDGIYNLRWIPDDGQNGFAGPRCKKRWGFFLFFPLLFTEYFMSATLEADIFRTANFTAQPTSKTAP